MAMMAARDSVRALRCLLCGEGIDPVIATNRQGYQQPTKNRARVPGASERGKAAIAGGEPRGTRSIHCDATIQLVKKARS
jgi:hypothetical protein